MLLLLWLLYYGSLHPTTKPIPRSQLLRRNSFEDVGITASLHKIDEGLVYRSVLEDDGFDGLAHQHAMESLISLRSPWYSSMENLISDDA